MQIIHMTEFTYNDIVLARKEAPRELRPGNRARIVGVFENRLRSYFDRFPDGVVYTIEFEDGTSSDVQESDLEPIA